MEATPSAPVPPRPVLRPNIVHRLRRWTTWFGVGRLIAAGASVVLVAGAAWWLLRTPHPSTESQLPYAPGATVRSSATVPLSATSLAPSTSVTDVVVHVAGAVVSPGVYHLPASARVVDAIAAAGGAGPEADTNGVNLAAPLRDGARIYVPAHGEPVPVVVAGDAAAPAGTGPPAPVDLNTATAEQLDDLPGVGPSTAAAIIAYRDAHGPFATAEDLGEVRGIGPAKLDALRGLVTT